MGERLFIGIDPGKKGALAILDGENIEIHHYDQSEYISVLKSVKQHGNVTCCIEDVHALRGNGITSSFVFGKSYGWLLGMLDTLGIPYQAVSPQKWKKDFGLLRSDKSKSVDVCQHLLPNANLYRTERCKKPDDGMAEAALLAIYARRHF